MSTITRDIITDLLPVYLSGEASADTKSLVESFMKSDPEFAHLVKSESQTILPNRMPEQTKEKEMVALQQTKKKVRLRSWFLGLAIFFSVCPLSFYHDSAKGVNSFMLRDDPSTAAIYAAIGAIFWILYFRTRRRLQQTGI